MKPLHWNSPVGVARLNARRSPAVRRYFRCGMKDKSRAADRVWSGCDLIQVKAKNGHSS
jgi:hypothetical protein